MPIWDVLVCDAGSHVEHDNTALAVNVVAVAKTTELLLASGIPDVELDGAQVLPIVSDCRFARRKARNILW